MPCNVELADTSAELAALLEDCIQEDASEGSILALEQAAINTRTKSASYFDLQRKLLNEVSFAECDLCDKNSNAALQGLPYPVYTRRTGRVFQERGVRRRVPTRSVPRDVSP